MKKRIKKSEKLRRRLKHFALKKLGTPYKYGVKKSEIGKFFDCSSLVQYLYRRIGIELPRSTILQAARGRVIPPRSGPEIFKPEDLKIGDLLFFKGSKGHYNKKFPEGIGHVTMYLGDGWFIHASGHGPRNNQKVKLEKFEKVISRADFRIAKRIIKD